MESIAISRFKHMKTQDFVSLESPKLVVNCYTGEKVAVLIPYDLYRALQHELVKLRTPIAKELPATLD